MRPPSGYEGHLSRRQAASELGLPSEFKIRQFEREGRLRPVRGVMGSAWYSRAEVLALRAVVRGTPAPVNRGQRVSDGELLALLRHEKAAGQPRSLVDLVVEGGVSIARAEKIYRFWLKHDEEALATQVRAGRGAPLLAKEPSERRASTRIERDSLIAQMRDPDPRVRATAFERLKQTR